MHAPFHFHIWTDAKQPHYSTLLLGGAPLQDLAIKDEGWDQSRHTSSCQLIVNIASCCTRLKTLAVNFGLSYMASEHASEAFPAAVSRLTALESLALQHLVLLVRSALTCATRECKIDTCTSIPGCLDHTWTCANHCFLILCPLHE